MTHNTTHTGSQTDIKNTKNTISVRRVGGGVSVEEVNLGHSFQVRCYDDSMFVIRISMLELARGKLNLSNMESFIPQHWMYA